MKNLTPYYFIFAFLIALCSCKKQQKEVVPAPAASVTKNPVSYSDSISFSIGSQLYVFGSRYKAGISNRAIDVKPSPTKIPGGKLAEETGGFYWYGVPDSTLYSVFYGFPSVVSGNELDVSFTKRYKDGVLTRQGALLVADNHLDIIKKGKQSFAVDYDKENTMDGIVIELYKQGKFLTTAIPGSSILVRSNLKNDIQNNSSFEITKVEQIQDDRYVVEARFDVNLFDEDAKLYRAANGFLRFTTNMNPTKNGFIIL